MTCAAAQEPGPAIDEVRGLHVALAPGGGVDLAWQAPRTSPDSYQVRRCLIASLRVPYYGNCIAQGLMTRDFVDPAPAGNVFYLVSGEYGTSEGSLGHQWNGVAATERTAPACSSPETSRPVTLTVANDVDQHICGIRLILDYPTTALTYQSVDCTGATAGYFPFTNDTVPGEVIHTCSSSTGSRTPGDIAAFHFQRGDCPVTLSVFEMTLCEITVGVPDCSNPTTVEEPCILTLN